jgi:uncharacterized protein YegP (UPF0339 family)
MTRSRDKMEVYRDRELGWRWRLVAANGKIIAVGGEGFTRKWSAYRAGKRATRSWVDPPPDPETPDPETPL